ncbi:MAG: phosphoadenosine phosphosulfate reductase family protein [Candidatus Helarchaeota archaeon]|nr:phosphoadenosine phosphosulfate reductase family protein [Candidatus Helarchaeota archaeon]
MIKLVSHKSINKKENVCNNCFNINYFDPSTNRTIKIEENGLCSLCNQDLYDKGNFFALKGKVINELPKIFEKVKKEKHEYDAILWLSGGKDSSAALILAKEKYDLNLLAFTLDRGNHFKQTTENIRNLTDDLGVDHINIKIPKKIFGNIFKFGMQTMNITAICCKVCGSLMFIPISSKILLKYDIPIVINGIDLWEIYGAYLDQKWRENQNEINKNFNQFYQYIPQFGQLLNDYKHIIKKIITLLNSYSKNNEHFEELKGEFLRTIEPLKCYWLTEEEKRKFNEINKKIKYIPLTAIEISKKTELMDLLKKYNWKTPKLPSGEIVGTDCQAGGIVNAIMSFDAKRKLWSYRILSGLVTKQQALDEINKPINFEPLKETMKHFGLKKLENRLKYGWKNPKYRRIYNLGVIDKLNQ